jgi:hypothetical protein
VGVPAGAGVCARGLEGLGKVGVHLCAFKAAMPQKKGDAFNVHAIL